MGLTDNKTILLAIRAVQAVFAIIVLGLAGYVAHWWSGYWNSGSPSEINFLIFCAVWTLLVLIYLFLVDSARLSHSTIAHPYAVLAADALTMLFWFAGFIAVAVLVGGRRCLGSVCSSAKAAAAFGAFEWILFAITTTLAALRLRSGHVGTSRTTAPVASV